MVSSKLKLVLGVSLIGLAASSSYLSAGTIHYRWKDDRGNPVHSDRPPPRGVDYEVITTGSGLKRVVSAEEGAVPAEITPRVGNEFSQVNPDEAKRSKKNPELCKRASSDLAALTGNSKVKIRDQNGDERFLSAEEMIVQREKTRAQISVYCS